MASRKISVPRLVIRRTGMPTSPRPMDVSLNFCKLVSHWKRRAIVLQDG